MLTGAEKLNPGTTDAARESAPSEVLKICHINLLLTENGEVLCPEINGWREQKLCRMRQVFCTSALIPIGNEKKTGDAARSCITRGGELKKNSMAQLMLLRFDGKLLVIFAFYLHQFIPFFSGSGQSLKVFLVMFFDSSL